MCLIGLVIISAAATKLPYEFNSDVVNDELYQLPDLPYNYNGLEPFLNEATLKVHHTGHLAGYTKKINAVLKDWREAVRSRFEPASCKYHIPFNSRTTINSN